MTDTDRLSSLLLNATAKQAQAVWREAEQLGIGDQVRRAWLDKMAVDRSYVSRKMSV